MWRRDAGQVLGHGLGAVQSAVLALDACAQHTDLRALLAAVAAGLTPALTRGRDWRQGMWRVWVREPGHWVWTALRCNTLRAAPP